MWAFMSNAFKCHVYCIAPCALIQAASCLVYHILSVCTVWFNI